MSGPWMSPIRSGFLGMSGHPWVQFPSEEAIIPQIWSAPRWLYMEGVMGTVPMQIYTYWIYVSRPCTKLNRRHVILDITGNTAELQSLIAYINARRLLSLHPRGTRRKIGQSDSSERHSLLTPASTTRMSSYSILVSMGVGQAYLVTLQWERKDPGGIAPPGRGYHTALLHDARIYVVGGYNGSKIFSDLWALELGASAYLPQVVSRSEVVADVSDHFRNR